MIVQLVGLDLLAAVVGIELWTGQVKSLFLVGCMRLVCLAGGGGTSLICVHVCSFVLLCCLGRIYAALIGSHLVQGVDSAKLHSQGG